MVTVAAAGPNWTDVMTAFGTVGAVVVALWIAIWTQRRADRQAAGERKHSDQQLAEQRELDKTAIEDERAHGRAQLEEERRITREQGQLADAYAVQVVLGQRPGDPGGIGTNGDPLPSETRYLAVMVVNRSPFTITRLEAQFCMGNSITPAHRYVRVASLRNVCEALREDFGPSAERTMHGVLTPFDTGIRFETDQIHEKYLSGPYPVVRWMDHRGTHWEHKRGVVRQITDNEQWTL